MPRLADIRIRSKLILLFIIGSSIPLFAVGIIISHLASDSLMEKSYDQLITVQSIRKSQIEEYFQRSFAVARGIANSSWMCDIDSALEEYFADPPGRKIKTPEAGAQRILPPYLSSLQRQLGEHDFEDFYIIDAVEGKVLFSLRKGIITGTSLRSGQYRDTGLADAWRQTLQSGDGAIVDFRSFAPQDGEMVAFIAQVIRDRRQRIKGVLVLQMTTEMITRAVDSRKGLGKTGESYILGASRENTHFEFRSNMQTMGDGKYVVGYSVDPPEYWIDTVNAGSGGHGLYVDSVGHKVLVTHDKLDIAGLNWYLISKIDRFEVTGPIRKMYLYIFWLAVVLVIVICIAAVYLSRRLMQPILREIQFAGEIAQGNFTGRLDVDQLDEVGDLAKALNTMARNLQNLDWLKQGKEALDDELRGEHTPGELNRRLVLFVVKYLKAQFGAVFIKSEEVLLIDTIWPFRDELQGIQTVTMGKGIVGQAARENRIIISTGEEELSLTDCRADETSSCLVAAPVTFEEKVHGVLLLGSATPFNQLQMIFLQQNIRNFAILLNSAYSRHVIEKLLDEATGHEKKLLAANDKLDAKVRELEIVQKKLEESNEQLLQLSSTDGLTGLLNRREFDRVFGEECVRSLRTCKKLSFIILDIDFFKAYNDTYGHAAGDECLKQVAQVIAATARRGIDKVARVGGEEFGVILPETDRKGSLHVAELIREAVAAAGMKHEGSSVSDVVTVSLGVVSRIAAKNGAASTLYEAADQALYRAKENGRNRVEFAEE